MGMREGGRMRRRDELEETKPEREMKRGGRRRFFSWLNPSPPSPPPPPFSHACMHSLCRSTVYRKCVSENKGTRSSPNIPLCREASKVGLEMMYLQISVMLVGS
jgi:hypothetical protein